MSLLADISRALIAGTLVGLLVAPNVVAQTAFPFPAAAPLPNPGPLSDVSPPNTFPPPGLAQNPVVSINDPFFGSSSPIYRFAIPVKVAAAQPVGCYSGPNATPEEAANALLFDEEPAGAQFIVFFARGARLFVLNLSTNNYCWIDGYVLPV
jgi:hypothetical protein